MNIDRYIIDDSKTLVWTLTSHGYQFMTLNLVHCFRKIGVPWKLCVICADDASFQFMRREGVSAIKASTQLPDFGIDISPFGSGNFQRLNLLKLKILDTFSKDDRINNCVYMDGDIAVYKDFIPDIIVRLKEHPLIFQCDEQKRDIVCASTNCSWVCSGFIAFMKGADKGIFNMTNKEIWQKKPEDQAWVNYALQKDAVPYITLPRNLYPNGTFVNLIASAQEKEAFLLHYNYRIGRQKEADMKRFGDWHLVL